MNVAASLDGVGDRIVPRDQIRTMRMQRHLAVAGFACVADVVIGLAVGRLLELVLLVVIIYVVLESLARAADARLGYWWGWLYGEPTKPTRLDLLVDDMVHRLGAARFGDPSAPNSAFDPADTEPKVRILPL